MIEIERQALQLLLQLTLVFSASVASLILLRPLLRRGFGAAAPYLACLRSRRRSSSGCCIPQPLLSIAAGPLWQLFNRAWA